MNYYKRPFWYSPFFYLLILVLLGAIGFVYWSITKPLPEISTISDTQKGIEFSEDLSSILREKDGKVRVIKNISEDEQEITINDPIKTGDIITTFDESKATITFGDVAHIRLDENSAIKILEAQDNTLTVQQIKGNVYHRVDKNNISFAVQLPDAQFTSQKSIMNINYNKNSKQAQVHVLGNTVDAQLLKDGIPLNSFVIKEGTYTEINSSTQKKPTFTEIDTKKIIEENIWLSWNVDADKKYSLGSGVLADSTLPQEIILNGRYENKLVLLDWKLDDGIAKNGFRVVMSDKTTEPTYPEHTNHYIRNNDKRSDQWRNLQAGTYHFRVGLYDSNGDILQYSNAVSIAVDSESENNQKISLSLSEDSEAPKLSWTTENLSEVEKFYIVSSESKKPSYPQSSYKELDKSSSSFTWNNLDDGQKYYFRICGVINKNCSVYSNEVSWDPTKETAKGSISLSAIQTNTSVYLEWQAKDLTSNNLGYRILLSENTNPSLNTSIVKIIDSRATNAFTWNDLNENTKYYFSVCEYLGNNTCGTFSNTVPVTIPTQAVSNESASIVVSGYYTWGKLHLNWESNNLQAISGYYVMVSDTANPTYPNAPYHIIDKDESYDSWTVDDAKTGDDYFIKVCAHVQGSCIQYSNELKVKIQ